MPEPKTAIVKYSLGATVNTGNYENLKVKVGLEEECDLKDVKKTYENVCKYVKKMLKENIKELRG